MKQYKVIKATMKKSGILSDWFEPEQLEEELNSLAAEGWKLAFPYGRAVEGEFILIMERDA